MRVSLCFVPVVVAFDAAVVAVVGTIELDVELVVVAVVAVEVQRFDESIKENIRILAQLT